MQCDADRFQVAGYYGMSQEILECVYGHHHPKHLASVLDAIERKS